MKITFYDDVKFKEFLTTIRDEYFNEQFELFGQLVMIHTISAYDRGPEGGVVEIDLVQSF